jgi:hypothetical protein
MLESRFVRPQTVASQNAVFILAKAPSYRLGISSQAPISTNQYYGNLYNRYSMQTTNKHLSSGSTTLSTHLNLALTKSKVSTSIMFLMKPYKNHLKKTSVSLLVNKAKNSRLKTLSGLYQNLLYTTLITAHVLAINKTTPTSDESSSTLNRVKLRVTLRRSINLKSRLITRRPAKKPQISTTKGLSKLVFIDNNRLVSKNKKFL